jgi:hypothetical protein
VWPTGQPRPNASNLNVNSGATVPNLVLAGAGAGGRISIYNDAGTAHVLVDLVGVVPVQNALDRPDDTAGSKFHVAYVQGSDSIADPAMVDKIRNDVSALNDWFAIETGRHLNVDRFDGQIEVTTWRVATLTKSQLADWPDDPNLTLLQTLVSDGFGNPYGRRWLVYLDTAGLPVGSGFCGVTLGQFATNLTTSPCATITGTLTANEVGTTVNSAQVSIHEMMHSLGAVPQCAPNIDKVTDPAYRPSNSIGHSADVHDLMYWNVGNQPKHIDPGHDDYYGTGRADCLDIATSPFVAST